MVDQMVQCLDLCWVEMKVDLWDDLMVQQMVVSKVVKTVDWTVPATVLLMAESLVDYLDLEKAGWLVIEKAESMVESSDLNLA